jgi:hypothetical protein
MHRAGLEPASLRLKGGGSAVELSVRRALPGRAARGMHREGFEPPAVSLEGSRSDSVELPVPLYSMHRFLLVSMVALPPVHHSTFVIQHSLPCTRQGSNLQPAG